MNSGFLPLIEAFLAFALTILALTTAVSALVGTFQRLMRWRPRVLRGMVEFFYRNDVLDLVTEIWEEHKKTSPADPGAGLPAELQAYAANPGDDKQRRRFVAHMTLMPAVLLTNKGAPDIDARERAIEKTETKDPDDYWAMVRDYIPGWRSLKHGLDRISDEDFLIRLKSSQPGQVIAKLAGDQADAVLMGLKQAFDATGNASYDLFRKRSRTWSVFTGFLLALFVNIDSLHLLNSYLTDEALRLQIIDESESITQDASKSAEDVARARQVVSQEAQALSDRVNEAAATLKKLAQTAGGAAEGLPLDGMEASVTRLQEGLTKFETSMDAVVETSDAIKQATAEVNGISQSLMQSFPVGWTLFPNCLKANEDLRCRTVRQSEDFSQETKLSEMNFVSAVNRARRVDPSAFYKWLIGILITGMMVGLGTPFWIQVVNGAIAARQFVRGKKTQGDGKADDKTDK